MIILCLAGIILTVISLPNPLIYFPLGIFVSFIPLFIINIRYNGLKLFILNILFSGGVALSVLIPLDPSKMIFDPNVIMVLILFFIIAIIYAVFFTLGSYVMNRSNLFLKPAIFGFAWVLAQVFLSKVPLLFPFPLESALTDLTVYIQSVRLFGFYVLGFLIFFTNASIALIFLLHRRRYWVIPLLMLLIVNLLNFGYGSISIDSSDFRSDGIKVAIIQPNIMSKERFLMERGKIFNKYFNNRSIYLSKAALNEGAELIVWPELSDNFILQNDEYLSHLHKEITSKGAELLIGTSYKDYLNDNSIYNIAFILDKNGIAEGPYKKQRVFSFIESEHYSNSSDSLLLNSRSKLGDIGVMICVESMYSSIARKLVGQGASTLFLISSDTSFGNSCIPYLHSRLIVLRALENNRYAAHVSNSGPPLVSDNRGRILLEIPYGKKAFGVVEMAAN